MTTRTRPRDPRASGGGLLLFPLTESGRPSRGEAGAKKRPEGWGHSPSRSHRIRSRPSNVAVASPRVSWDISAGEPVSAVRRACRTKRGRSVEATAFLVPRGANLAAAQALSPLWCDKWNEALCLCPTGLSLTSDPIPHSREASRFLYEGLPCGLNCVPACPSPKMVPASPPLPTPQRFYRRRTSSSADTWRTTRGSSSPSLSPSHSRQHPPSRPVSPAISICPCPCLHMARDAV